MIDVCNYFAFNQSRYISEETELVIKILELCGILIKDLGLYQIFDKEDQETIQQQKS